MSASVDIHPREGKHQVRWREPGGRRRAKTFSRERDATRFAARMRTVLESGGVLALDEEIPTLAEFVETYWRIYAVPNLAPNTRKTYKQVWGKHIRPRLGDLRLRAVTAAAIDKQLVGPMRDAGVGDQAILKTLTMLGSVMSLAVVHHAAVVPANPVELVRKPKQARREAEPIWPTVVEQLRAHVGHRDAVLISVLAYGGLRPEEALALEWRDIRDEVIVVERALALGEIRGSDRQKRHDRQVLLLAPLAKDLAEWRLASGRPGARRLVFPDDASGHWTDSAWRSWRRNVWQPAAAAIGIATLERKTWRETDPDGERRRHSRSRYEGPRPYDLRGSFVSLLVWEGKTIVEVADQAGHSAETCLRRYARVFRDAPAEKVPAEVAIRRAREADGVRIAR